MDAHLLTLLPMWPTPQDYNESIQNPQLCFADSELRACLPETNVLGLPKPISGSFASVYHMRGPHKQFAVRCFLRDVPDQAWRYDLITKFLYRRTIPYMVPFEFIAEGIKVGGQWYPILKMEWSTGTSLIEWIQANLGSPDQIESLLHSFERMCANLQELGIAHGDLQHGNILIKNNELQLVDYDGMFVPALKGHQSNELGHRHYQHPRRNSRDFGPYLDNFSAWSIYTSLYCLAKDNRLWQDLGAGDEGLLFRQDDYHNPTESIAFRHLEHHDSANIREATKTLRALLNQRLDQVPPLGEPIIDRPEVADLSPFVLPARSGGERINLRLASAPTVMLKTPPPRLRVVDEEAPKLPGFARPHRPRPQPSNRGSSKPPYTVPPSRPKKNFWTSGYALPLFFFAIFASMGIATSLRFVGPTSAPSPASSAQVEFETEDRAVNDLYKEGRQWYKTAASQGNSKAASENYLLAWNCFDRIKNRVTGMNRAQLEYQTARCEANLKRYQMALDHFQDAKQVFLTGGKYIADIDWYIGEMQIRIRDYAAAAETFTQMRASCQFYRLPGEYTNSAFDGLRRASIGLLLHKEEAGFGYYHKYLEDTYLLRSEPGTEIEFLQTAYKDLQKAAKTHEQLKDYAFAWRIRSMLANVLSDEHVPGSLTPQDERQIRAWQLDVAKAMLADAQKAKDPQQIDESKLWLQSVTNAVPTPSPNNAIRKLRPRPRPPQESNQETIEINAPPAPTNDPAVMNSNPKLYKQ